MVKGLVLEGKEWVWGGVVSLWYFANTLEALHASMGFSGRT